MAEPTLITLGCRLNAFESEAMRTHAAKAGLDDFVIVNTCAVTGEAVRQAGQAIRKARRERPQARIIVTGCAAQIEPQRFAEMKDVDHVIGNAEKTRAETFHALAAGAHARVAVGDIQAERRTSPQAPDVQGPRARAYVQVQNGCDHRCTFCVIPLGRGPSRSVEPEAVVAQVRCLAGGGCREVVLTGVDITAYGADLAVPMALGRLVQEILRSVPELERLRLSSIDCAETDDALLDALASEPRLMPYLHLSLQSGDDLILKRMKRRHNRGDAIRFCAEVRRRRPEVVIGADLIAGFPTETEDMFQNTLRLVDDCRLTHLHVFPFSARPDTPAARMPQTDRGVVKARAERLRAKGAAARASYFALQVGREREVLIESEGLGRTADYAEVAIDGGLSAGSMARVLVDGHDGRRLKGRVVA